MVVLAVTWIANEDTEQEVIQAFERLAEASRREPGCKMYLVHQDREDKRRFFVYEQYINEQALQAHREAPHFQEIAAKTLPKLGNRAEAYLMDPVA